jgi:hypothetical protein
MKSIILPSPILGARAKNEQTQQSQTIIWCGHREIICLLLMAIFLVYKVTFSASKAVCYFDVFATCKITIF